MELQPDRLESLLARLSSLLASAGPTLPAGRRVAVERWRGDAEALRFHLRGLTRTPSHPLILAVIGGTGTGKSTMVNRLVGQNLSAASFRRTFTAGPVVLVRGAGDLPQGWLGVEHTTATPAELPARGRPGALVVVVIGDAPAGGTSPENAPAPLPVIVDTPDLDGDQPAHHAQADRVFRWAEAILFLVTPEKYQMTELPPYYRLARRYGVPTLYAMNKCEEQAVADDYAQQLASGALLGAGDGDPAAEPATAAEAPRVFIIPRADSGYESPAGQNSAALRAAIATLPRADADARRRGVRNRSADVLGRFVDHVLAPLQEDRREADRMAAALRALEAPAPGVDVNPVTQQLQRRLQQRSILYLMGPQRIMERVRQAPVILARLPRVAWDYLRKGELSAELLNPAGGGKGQQVPDFRATLMDQFAVLQSRVDDVLRANALGRGWIEEADKAYTASRVDTTRAGDIADEELGELKRWLEQKWNATPRDTRTIESLLKKLPGGRTLTRWSEAAPYLLTVVLITHGAVFGHLDLMILGGYSAFAWLTERLSNEVTARTRAANARIEQRFADLAHEQIEKVCAWLDKQAPHRKTLEQLERAAGEVQSIGAL